MLVPAYIQRISREAHGTLTTRLLGPHRPGFIHLFIPVQSVALNSFIYSFVQATFPIPWKAIPFGLANCSLKPLQIGSEGRS